VFHDFFGIAARARSENSESHSVKQLSLASYKLPPFFGSDFKKESKHAFLCRVKKLEVREWNPGLWS
jgi:hypothetical protein